MLGIISPFQSAYVAGRSTFAVVLVVFEVIHHMKHKLKGKKGEVALKIDISKAYDSLDWGFLYEIMHKMGFSAKWINMIMLCVTIVSYSALINGHEGPSLLVVVCVKVILSPYIYASFV